jgi:TonB family protein
MRLSPLLLLVSLLSAHFAWSQVTEVPSAQTGSLPMYRPVLIGKGSQSLIDRIDTKDLMEKGQKDAVVRFLCSVKKSGEVEWSLIFGATPDSEALQAELQKKLAAASDPRFIPAVYNHHTVDAIYYATCTFAVADGKPRLRIFSNQETDELVKENDFIDPQPFFGEGSPFRGFHYPENAEVTVDGVVQIKVKVDETGNLQDMQMVSEEPPFMGFGDAALDDFRNTRFIPAFRSGRPVACEVTLPVLYKSKGVF